MINGIHHVSLKCASKEAFEKAVFFYQETLSLPVYFKWNGGILLGLGNGLIEIFDDASDVLPQGTIRHVALATDDVERCVAAVRAAGYAITMEPREILMGGDPAFPAKIAFCIGPVGEEIEFFQDKKQK